VLPPQDIPKDWLVTMMIGILGAWGCLLLAKDEEGKHVLDAEADIKNLQNRGVLKTSEFVDFHLCTTDTSDFIYIQHKG